MQRKSSGVLCGIGVIGAAVNVTTEILSIMKKHNVVLLSNSETPASTEELSIVTASNEALIECEYGMANEMIEGADGYAQIAPYGDALNIHPEGFTVIQRFNLSDAQKLVSQFNQRKADEEEVFPGVPIYKKHPKRDGVAMANDDRRWLGRFTDLQARDTGLYGKAQVNKLGKKIGLANRFPTAHWFCQVTGKENDKLVLQPFELEHVGLTNRPNLPVAPMFNEAANAQLALLNAKDAAGHGSNAKDEAGAWKPITTFKNEKHLFSHGNEHLVEADHGGIPGKRIVVAVNKDGHTDYPIRHDDGNVVYDYPEKFTKAFREKVAAHSFGHAATSNEGNSEGVRKAWETRRGGASAVAEHAAASPFAKAYIRAALWSSSDNSNDQGGDPLDKNYDHTHLHPAAMHKMISDAHAFEQTHKDKLGSDPEKAGHDFWLTRNHHGAGFWDSEDHYGAENAKALTDAAHAAGERDLYVGDDKKIHESHEHIGDTAKRTPVTRADLEKKNLETQGKIELEDQPNDRNSGGFKPVAKFTGKISDEQNVVGGYNVGHSTPNGAGFVKQHPEGWVPYTNKGDRIGKTLHASREDAAQEALDHDNDNEKVIGTVGKTDTGKGVEIGGGLTVVRHGMDANGNHSVWISKDGARAGKIQTNGNLPKYHGSGDRDSITLAHAKEIREYYNKTRPSTSNEAGDEERVAIGNQSPGTPGVADNNQQESDDMKAKEQLIALLAAAGYALGNEAGETEITVKVEEAKKRLSNVGTIEVAMANEKEAGKTLAADLALAKQTAATLQVTLDNTKREDGAQIAALTNEKQQLVTAHATALDNEKREVTRLTGELTIVTGKLTQADGNLRKVSTDLQVAETILSNERAERTKLTVAATQTQKELLTATTALSNEQKRVKELDGKIAGMTTALANHKAALVDFAIATGRILPAQRETFTATLSNDEGVSKIFKTLAAAKPALKVIPLMNNISREHASSQDASKQFVALVNEIQTTQGISRDDAWQKAKKDARGEALLVLMHQPETGIPVATR